MSLLPGQILPPDTPIGKTDDQGNVTINHDWWLLLYNLCLQILGNGSGLPADALIDLESADTDAIDADAIALRRPVANLEVQQYDYTPSSSELPDIARALLLAQDNLLPDSIPQAQPVSTILATGSPFTYTASANGQLCVAGGSVSILQIIRQGTAVTTGLTAGLIPLSRLDQVVVTYGSAPTLTFLPT